MNTSGNTILITGVTSGIGFVLAAQLLRLSNTVIVTGRDQRRIEGAQRKLPGIHSFQSDVTDAREIPLLFNAVVENFPGLNLLINNAGIMRKIDLQVTRNDIEDINREIETNLTGPVRMVRQFLPHLKAQDLAAIVNVSSGLAFVPFPIAPIYCAAKAAMHSFTLSLRAQLRHTRIKVFELAPPATDTPLLTEDFRVGLSKAGPPMEVSKLVSGAIKGLRKDQYEIRPGLSKVLKLMSRVAPEFILNQLSKPMEAMLARAESR